MISKLTHSSIIVLDQTSAHDFYVNKLGFTPVVDVPMPQGGRWLTVSPPGQPDVELILSPVEQNANTPEKVALLTELVKTGTFGVAVFTCDDIYATYEEMKAKGVHFKKAPTKEFYGTEAIFKDDSGNWFSLAQLPKP
ncbi:VOC family protein [Dinghuibacter silviterrae]|uniref:Catechol 2,3-dioxygenase-like lactoylglutathione lyase family enzyme n=1 Tax=Dinghuibacter silviterrae TaxID=1539049 RepID=A0A4R8DUQ0_9BACT|nr:VOC family protein [Dinghuibacter silviterrae]TDX02104.1 catechol 2,3-dioxygenase-like lactoylglutathione lyase family enzyme [Dinghuibacter silviterrae]